MRTASDIMGVPYPFCAWQEYSPVSEAETGSKTCRAETTCPAREPRACLLCLWILKPSAPCRCPSSPPSGLLPLCPDPFQPACPYQLPGLGVQAVGRVAEGTVSLGLQRHQGPIPVPQVLRGRGAVRLRTGQHRPAPDGGGGGDGDRGFGWRHWKGEKVLTTGQGGLLEAKWLTRALPQPPRD